MTWHLRHAALTALFIFAPAPGALNCPVLAATATVSVTQIAARDLAAEPEVGDDDQTPGERRAEPADPDGPSAGDDDEDERGNNRGGDKDFVPDSPPGCLFRQGPLELLV